MKSPGDLWSVLNGTQSGRPSTSKRTLEAQSKRKQNLMNGKQSGRPTVGHRTLEAQN